MVFFGKSSKKTKSGTPAGPQTNTPNNVPQINQNSKLLKNNSKKSKALHIAVKNDHETFITELYENFGE